MAERKSGGETEYVRRAMIQSVYSPGVNLFTLPTGLSHQL